MGSGGHSGRDDRCCVDHAAGRFALWPPGRVLPWALIVAGSVAGLAANVAVAEPITHPGALVRARREEAKLPIAVPPYSQCTRVF